jgi:hypothetical protein
MVEITSDDIALLNDEDLRTLVGLLCECELRAKGYSAASVTWGGNQNAARMMSPWISTTADVSPAGDGIT